MTDISQQANGKSYTRPSWKILLIDPDENHYRLIRSLSSDALNADIELLWERSYDSGMRALNSGSFDAVLVQHSQKSETGLNLIQAAGTLGLSSPCILLHSMDPIDIEPQAFQAGAFDCLSMNEMTPRLLERSLRAAASWRQLALENKHQRDALQDVYDLDPSPLAVLSGPEYTVQYANPAFAGSLDAGKTSPVGKPLGALLSPEAFRILEPALKNAFQSGEPAHLDIEQESLPDDSARSYGVELLPARWQGQNAIHLMLNETGSPAPLPQSLLLGWMTGDESSNILDAVLNNIPQGILVAAAPEGKITAISRYACTLFDLCYENVQGKTVSEYVQVFHLLRTDGSQPESEDELPLTRSVRQGEVIEGEEWCIQQPQGRLITISCNSGPIRDQDGSIRGAILAFRDITGQKQAEKELARHAEVFKQVQDAIIATDEEFNVTSWNQAAERLYGWSAAEAVGRSLNEMTRSEYRPGEVDRVLQKYVRDGHYRVEGIQYHRDGTRLYVESSGAVMQDENGKVTGYIIASRDVADRMKLESDREHMLNQIKESRRRIEKLAIEAQRRADELETVFNALADAVMLLNADGVIARVNPTALAFFGDDFTGQNRRDVVGDFVFYHLDGQPLKVDELPGMRALAGESVQQERYRLKNGNGDSFYVVASASPLYTRGQLSGAVVVYHDVTEQQSLMLRLEAERAKLSAVIANAPEAIVMVDSQGEVVISNPIADILYFQALPNPQPQGRENSVQICHLDGRHYTHEELPLVRSSKLGETHINLEMMLVGPDQQKRYMLSSTAPILDRRGKVSGAVGVFQEITKRKIAEEEMRQTAAQIEIQHYLTQYRERERLNIAHDLHDGPLQALIAMSYKLMELIQTAEEHAITAGLEDLNLSMQEQINDIRVFCNELRPPTLTPFGLEKAIRSHLETFRAAHPELALRLNLHKDAKTLPESTRLALFRIYRELLNNVIKHARASTVHVSFWVEEQNAFLEVSDDGVGFEMPDSWVELARQGHLGLVGVRERAESIQGFVQIRAQLGKGTSVRVIIPGAVTGDAGFGAN